MKSLLYQLTATLCFFTRLPLWRIITVPKEYYERVVPYWPIAGWVTGGSMALTCLATWSLPVNLTTLLCLVVRCLLTGGLHEDGFADFCDGFGGGCSRERILEIMKDSHIGTYGVLGLIFYFSLQIGTIGYILTQTHLYTAMCLMVSADTISKFLSSFIVYFLPYARTEQTAKNRLVYKKPRIHELMVGLLFAILPIMLLAEFGGENVLVPFTCATIGATLCMVTLTTCMKKKINGYTGDCCGATFIITEAFFYLIMTGTLS